MCEYDCLTFYIFIWLLSDLYIIDHVSWHLVTYQKNFVNKKLSSNYRISFTPSMMYAIMNPWYQTQKRKLEHQFIYKYINLLCSCFYGNCDFIRFEVFTRNSLPCDFINKFSEQYIETVLCFLKGFTNV